MSYPQRWIQVDDNEVGGSSPLLSYQGNWTLYDEKTASSSEVSPLGDLYKGTSHGTSSQASLVFRYEGTNASIRGSSSAIPSGGASISCTIDGVVGAVDVPTEDTLSHYRLCHTDNLSPALLNGLHEMIVNVTSREGFRYWVDFGLYFPLPGQSRIGKATQVGPTSSELKFGGAWRDLHGARAVNERDATIVLPFSGESVQMLGIAAPEQPRIGATGTWSIDGQSPNSFQILPYERGYKGLPPTKIRFRVPYFDTGPVPPGQHMLEVVFKGNATTTPMTLDKFLVYHGTAEAVVGSDSNTTPTKGGGDGNLTRDTQASNSGPPVGAIAGGVVGGAVLVLILLALYLFWKRKKGGKAPIDLTAKEGSTGITAFPFSGDDSRAATSPSHLTQGSVSSAPSQTYMPSFNQEKVAPLRFQHTSGPSSTAGPSGNSMYTLSPSAIHPVASSQDITSRSLIMADTKGDRQPARVVEEEAPPEYTPS